MTLAITPAAIGSKGHGKGNVRHLMLRWYKQNSKHLKGQFENRMDDDDMKADDERADNNERHEYHNK